MRGRRPGRGDDRREAELSETPKATPDEVWERVTGRFPGDLGIEQVEIGGDRAVGRIAVDSRHLHPGGYVHGGAWTTLGDTVAAWVTFHSLPPEHEFRTVELKLNVFGSGRVGDLLTATAAPLHVGRNTIVVEVRIERERRGESKLAANVIVTQIVLARD